MVVDARRPVCGGGVEGVGEALLDSVARKGQLSSVNVLLGTAGQEFEKFRGSRLDCETRKVWGTGKKRNMMHTWLCARRAAARH